MPDPQLWAALFPPDETPVAAFPPPKRLSDDIDIRTYGGAPIADFAREQYSDPDMIAAFQARHPGQDWLARPNGFLPFIDAAEHGRPPI